MALGLRLCNINVPARNPPFPLILINGVNHSFVHIRGVRG
jgi:hypothetical protein